MAGPGLATRPMSSRRGLVLAADHSSFTFHVSWEGLPCSAGQPVLVCALPTARRPCVLAREAGRCARAPMVRVNATCRLEEVSALLLALCAPPEGTEGRLRRAGVPRGGRAAPAL